VLHRPVELAQFTSWAFTDRAKASGLVPSMGSVGDCFDNSMVEAFWSRMQVELFNRKRWNTRIELANAIFDFLETWHNRQRRHSHSACSARASPETWGLRRRRSLGPGGDGSALARPRRV
jgi:transposase InsO family protein